MRGHLFESLIMSDSIKYYCNSGKPVALYFWRDVQGHEIVCIVEKSHNVLIPIEIKARMTRSMDIFKGLIDWNAITEQHDTPAYVIYAGTDHARLKHGDVVPWNSVHSLFKKLYS